MSLKPVNLALRFLLELAALLALSYGGFRIGHGVFQDLMLGVGMPMLAALVWGRFIAPESPLRVADPLRVALELGIFALAVAVLVFVGQSTWAAVLALAAVINIALMYLWKQR